MLRGVGKNRQTMVQSERRRHHTLFFVVFPLVLCSFGCPRQSTAALKECQRERDAGMADALKTISQLKLEMEHLASVGAVCMSASAS